VSPKICTIPEIRIFINTSRREKNWIKMQKELRSNYKSFQIFTDGIVWRVVFWVSTSWNLTGWKGRFIWTCCLHFQGWTAWATAQGHIRNLVVSAAPLLRRTESHDVTKYWPDLSHIQLSLITDIFCHIKITNKIQLTPKEVRGLLLLLIVILLVLA
jgi:hypothetical protein